MDEIRYSPIGVIRTPLPDPVGVPLQQRVYTVRADDRFLRP